jgi:hypothetical protein
MAIQTPFKANCIRKAIYVHVAQMQASDVESPEGVPYIATAVMPQMIEIHVWYLIAAQSSCKEYSTTKPRRNRTLACMYCTME